MRDVESTGGFWESVGKIVFGAKEEQFPNYSDEQLLGEYIAARARAGGNPGILLAKESRQNIESAKAKLKYQEEQIGKDSQEAINSREGLRAAVELKKVFESDRFGKVIEKYHDILPKANQASFVERVFGTQEKRSSTVTNGSFDYQGVAYNYRVCAPSGTPSTLIAAFHGLGGDAGSFDAQTGFCTKANERGMAVLEISAPNNTWTDSAVIPVKQIISDAQASLNVNNVNLVGHSLGGAMALKLFCQSDVRADNVYGVSTASDFAGCNPSNSTNVILYHYDGDQIVPYDGGESALSSIGYVLSQMNVTRTAALYDGCDINSVQNVQDGDCAVVTYDNCPDGKIVRHTECPPRPNSANQLLPSHSWQQGQTDKILNNIGGQVAPTTPPASNDGNGGLSQGAIIGLAAGGVVALAALAIFAGYKGVQWYRNRNNGANEQQPDVENQLGKHTGVVEMQRQKGEQLSK